MTDAAGGSPISSDEVREAFGGTDMASLQCQSSAYLVGVYTCWQHDSDGFPTKQIACPSDVIAEDTCTKDTVTVQAFDSR